MSFSLATNSSCLHGILYWKFLLILNTTLFSSAKSQDISQIFSFFPLKISLQRKVFGKSKVTLQFKCVLCTFIMNLILQRDWSQQMSSHFLNKIEFFFLDFWKTLQVFHYNILRKFSNNFQFCKFFCENSKKLKI